MQAELEAAGRQLVELRIQFSPELERAPSGPKPKRRRQNCVWRRASGMVVGGGADREGRSRGAYNPSQP
ncbi:hypothetical protein [Cupriavidus sp. 8B]